MQSYNWDSMSASWREALCRVIGLSYTMAKNEWRNLMPRTRYELCEALTRASSGHAALNAGDNDVLEYGLWLRSNPGQQAQLLFDLKNRVRDGEAAEKVLSAKLRKLLGE
jgi:hypothetical protein